MSRLTHTFLITAICWMCASPALARQREMNSLFPSSLIQARVNDPSSKTTSPAVDNFPANQRAPDFAPSTAFSAPSPAIAHPTPAQVISPFPRAATPIARMPIPFARPLTPFPRRKIPRSISLNEEGLNHEENFAQRFGTIMTFPAVDGLTDAAKIDQVTNFTDGNVNQTSKNNEARLTNRLANNSVNRKSILAIPGMDQVATLPGQVIRTTVIGPEVLIQDTPEIFEIEVTNNSSRIATNIVVQMGVSENLTITDFDRHAWLDEKNRTVSWKLDALQSGYKNVIRFRAVSSILGSHEQRITVGMENTFQGQTGFVAKVVQNPEGENLQLPNIEQ